MSKERDWADFAASRMVEAHINSWGMVPHPDFLKDMIAAGLRAAREQSLGPSISPHQQDIEP